jgi:hypothetical protein
MIAIGEKDSNIPVATAKSSYSFYYTYVYTGSPKERALYKAYNNPNVISDLDENLIGNT